MTDRTIRDVSLALLVLFCVFGAQTAPAVQRQVFQNAVAGWDERTGQWGCEGNVVLADADYADAMKVVAGLKDRYVIVEPVHGAEYNQVTRDVALEFSGIASNLAFYSGIMDYRSDQCRNLKEKSVDSYLSDAKRFMKTTIEFPQQMAPSTCYSEVKKCSGVAANYYSEAADFLRSIVKLIIDYKLDWGYATTQSLMMSRADGENRYKDDPVADFFLNLVPGLDAVKSSQPAEDAAGAAVLGYRILLSVFGWQSRNDDFVGTWYDEHGELYYVIRRVGDGYEIDLSYANSSSDEDFHGPRTETAQRDGSYLKWEEHPKHTYQNTARVVPNSGSNSLQVDYCRGTQEAGSIVLTRGQE